MQDSPETIHGLAELGDRDPVRLLQVTDCHIFADARERLQDMDTRRSFETVIAAARRESNRPDMLLATGDLSQDGSPESYAWLADRLDGLGVPVFWLPGNHDDTSVMTDHFRGKFIHEARRILAGSWQILMLDSTVTGEVFGCVSNSQLDFMEDSLREFPERYALVCMHHQAIDTGSEWIDAKGMKESRRLRERLARHDNLRGVLWGHVHQQAFHRIDGVTWMATPSTCVQFKPKSREFALHDAPPGYRYLSLKPDGAIDSEVRRVAID